MPLGEKQPYHESKKVPWPSQEQLKASRTLEKFEAAIDPTIPRRILVHCMKYLAGHTRRTVTFVRDYGLVREEEVDLYHLVLWRLERKGQHYKRDQFLALPPDELDFLIDTIIKKELLPEARKYRDRAIVLLDGPGQAYFSPSQARTAQAQLRSGGRIDSSLWDLLQEVMLADGLHNRPDYFERPHSAFDHTGGHYADENPDDSFGKHNANDVD
ncbi:MAG TPA: hypothetical protein VFG51_01465 [Candidatus Saccharimonadia bacterium]|nr:hypothetical protein [Candidatus Saccharimonadia bacterium]